MDKLLRLLVLIIVTAAPLAQADQVNPYDNRHYSRLDNINDYHKQLKEDIYELEHKAIVLSKKECIAGEESFNICDPEDLNIIEFILCLMKPFTTYHYDPLTRAVSFPKKAFKDIPALTVGIKGVGSLLFGKVKVKAEDVTYKGFNIVVDGGYPAYPYSVTVQWIACPRKHPFYPTVRDFVPRYPEPEPYKPPRTHPPLDTYPLPTPEHRPEEHHPPADPYEPTDPYHPPQTYHEPDVSQRSISPSSPTNPTQLTNSYPPNSPTIPTYSTNPTNPTNYYPPADPTHPTSPTYPTNPTQPTSPTYPTSPYSPTNPHNPTTSYQPTNRHQPTEPYVTTNPYHPTDPYNPTSPPNPTDTYETTEPYQYTDPYHSTEPYYPTTTPSPSDSYSSSHPTPNKRQRRNNGK